MKDFFSQNARDVIRGLTEKDENMRLGATKMSDLKEHAFFKGIDWEKLALNQVEAPFKPKVKSATDYSLIDPEFLSEDCTKSYHDCPETKIERNAGPESEIPNFQFINPKVLVEYGEK